MVSLLFGCFFGDPIPIHALVFFIYFKNFFALVPVLFFQFKKEGGRKRKLYEEIGGGKGGKLGEVI